MLVLISLGLWDEKDLSLRGFEEAKSCDLLYLESYTSKLGTGKQELEKLLGKTITLLSRKQVEENFESLLEQAKEQKVGILVGGDALVATTHSSLLLEAAKRKIPTRIVHSSSILSAVGETGLHLQKFGPWITIPLPERTSDPSSVFEVLKENERRGLHTLCLLDLDTEKRKFVSVEEALAFLSRVEDSKRKVVVISKLGSSEQKILYGTLEELGREKFDLPACLILPGRLHFAEEEFLSQLARSPHPRGDESR